MTEKYPPLLELPISKSTKQFLDQATVDRAMCVIYERRPDFLQWSVERDKSWERDPTQDEEAWVHDAFHKEFRQFIRDVVAKEIELPDLNAQTSVFQHARSVARLMYGMPVQNRTR